MGIQKHLRRRDPRSRSSRKLVWTVPRETVAFLSPVFTRFTNRDHFKIRPLIYTIPGWDWSGLWGFNGCPVSATPPSNEPQPAASWGGLTSHATPSHRFCPTPHNQTKNSSTEPPSPSQVRMQACARLPLMPKGCTAGCPFIFGTAGTRRTVMPIRPSRPCIMPKSPMGPPGSCLLTHAATARIIPVCRPSLLSTRSAPESRTAGSIVYLCRPSETSRTGPPLPRCQE